MKQQAILAWSGGKDSAFALYELLRSKEYEIAALLTTITEDYGRVSMHGIRESLIEQQAVSLGYSLQKVYISSHASNEDYEAAMKHMLLSYQQRGVCSVVFGDIFLEDLRRYREDRLSSIGMKGVFPLWKRDTQKLAQEFIETGFKAVITCVDTALLDKSFCGRPYERQLLCSLPSGVDPCGENGEFHTFAFDGPIFKARLDFKTGAVVLRDERFYFCDIIPHDVRAPVGSVSQPVGG